MWRLCGDNFLYCLFVASVFVFIGDDSIMKEGRE